MFPVGRCLSKEQFTLFTLDFPLARSVHQGVVSQRIRVVKDFVTLEASEDEFAKVRRMQVVSVIDLGIESFDTFFARKSTGGDGRGFDGFCGRDFWPSRLGR